MRAKAVRLDIVSSAQVLSTQFPLASSVSDLGFMPFGLFGPVTLRTRRGSITFVAGFVTVPLAAFSLWQLTRPAPSPANAQQPSAAGGDDDDPVA